MSFESDKEIINGIKYKTYPAEDVTGKQIQHLYRRSSGGYVVYDHTEVITVAHADYKTEILHLVIETLPTRDEVLEQLSREPEVTVEKQPFFAGVLPDWMFLQ